MEKSIKQYSKLFKALSDETRLRIMVLLTERELCVCQIEEALDLSQVKVSRHLTVLRYSGLVENRQDGIWVYYSLAQPKNEIEEGLFENFRTYLYKEDYFANDLSKMKECVLRPLKTISKKDQ